MSDDDRMPTICLSCGQDIPAAEYMEHRRHCQADIAADNQRHSGVPASAGLPLPRTAAEILADRAREILAGGTS